MCLIDWQLGRWIRSKHTRISANIGVDTQLVPHDSDRVALWIFPPDDTALSISINQPITVGVFMDLLAGADPLYFSLIRDGDWCQQEFRAVSAARGWQLGVVECTIPERALNDNIPNLMGIE